MMSRRRGDERIENGFVVPFVPLFRCNIIYTIPSISRLLSTPLKKKIHEQMTFNAVLCSHYITPQNCFILLRLFDYLLVVKCLVLSTLNQVKCSLKCKRKCYEIRKRFKSIKPKY